MREKKCYCCNNIIDDSDREKYIVMLFNDRKYYLHNNSCRKKYRNKLLQEIKNNLKQEMIN